MTTNGETATPIRKPPDDTDAEQHAVRTGERPGRPWTQNGEQRTTTIDEEATEDIDGDRQDDRTGDRQDD